MNADKIWNSLTLRDKIKYLKKNDDSTVDILKSRCLSLIYLLLSQRELLKTINKKKKASEKQCAGKDREIVKLKEMIKRMGGSACL